MQKHYKREKDRRYSKYSPSRSRSKSRDRHHKRSHRSRSRSHQKHSKKQHRRQYGDSDHYRERRYEKQQKRYRDDYYKQKDRPQKSSNYQKNKDDSKHRIENKFNFNMNVGSMPIKMDVHHTSLSNYYINTEYSQNVYTQRPYNFQTHINPTYRKSDVPLKLNLQNQGNYKHARRLYVGNIPENITNQALQATGGLLQPGNPISSLKIDDRGKFAFVQLRSIQQTSSAFQLDGIFLWNRQLRIRRPTQYDKFPKVQGTRSVPVLNISLLENIGIEIISTQVQNGPNKLYLANLPNNMDQYHLINNLELKKYGKLKSFHLVKDSITNESKGYAFFQYQHPQYSTNCIQCLNGCLFNGKPIICKVAQLKQNEQGNNMIPLQ